MKYYIEISAWNLLESFATESLSPFFFYAKRDYGNNLSRYLNGENDKMSFLILSTSDFGGDYSVCVDENLLDKRRLCPIKNSTALFTYDRTIYYQKNYVSFRFSREELKTSLITESKILYEIKCLDKYSSSFIVKEGKKVKGRKSLVKLGESIRFDSTLHIQFDNYYNRLKGAITGFVRGLFTKSNSSEQSLLKNLINLKNTFAGLYTQISLDESFVIHGCEIIDQIVECKKQYMQQYGATNLFEILSHQYKEIINIVNKRTIEPNSSKESELECKLQSLEYELNTIKRQEEDNGLATGQKRKFFKKDSPEAIRKDYLKKEIEEIKSQLSNYSDNKYDALLSAIFNRISDILNEIIKRSSEITNANNVNFSMIKFDGKNLYIDIDSDKDNAEIEYLNILLNCIFSHELQKQISDNYVLTIIEESANMFKSSNISQTSDGKQIVDCLREFWIYKNNKSESFSIPESMPVFQSIMSFFVKPLSFEQIERYMLNKKYTEKSYAFMLWGACIGFADMPKTFTSILYENSEVTDLLDNYLLNTYKILNKTVSIY